MPSLELGGIS